MGRNYWYLAFLLSGLLLCCGMLNGQSTHGSVKFKGEGIYLLKAENITMEIDAMGGARIISFRLGNKEILSTKEVNQENFGSTLWASLQIWKWPPSAVLDREEYSAMLTNNVLKLTSSADSISGFTFIKTFSFEESGKAINVRYEIINTSKKERSVAPWEVTRVPAGGLTFFPDGLEGGYSKSNLNTEIIKGIAWFPYKPVLVDDHQKLFSDGSEGWLAHVNNGLLFIKQFPDGVEQRVPVTEQKCIIQSKVLQCGERKTIETIKLITYKTN